MLNFLRVIKSGFLTFWRNKWLSAATISIMALSILMITGLLFINVITESLLKNLQDKIDISIYFKLDVDEDEILSIKSDLSTLEEIRSVEYISREKALEEFKNRHKENDVLMQSLEELGGNPLQATINVKTNAPSQYASVATFLDNVMYKDLIDKVNYQQNKEVIEKFSNFSNLIRRVGLISSIVLVMIAVLVAFNTVRLAMFNMKDEISVMRLVGATNWFVRGPFIVEGVVHGLTAVFVSLLVIYPILTWLSPKISYVLPEADLAYWFKINFLQVFLLQIVVGVGLGAASSMIAIRRYLKA